MFVLLIKDGNLHYIKLKLSLSYLVIKKKQIQSDQKVNPREDIEILSEIEKLRYQLENYQTQYKELQKYHKWLQQQQKIRTTHQLSEERLARILEYRQHSLTKEQKELENDLEYLLELDSYIKENPGNEEAAKKLGTSLQEINTRLGIRERVSYNKDYGYFDITINEIFARLDVVNHHLDENNEYMNTMEIYGLMTEEEFAAESNALKKIIKDFGVIIDQREQESYSAIPRTEASDLTIKEIKHKLRIISNSINEQMENERIKFNTTTEKAELLTILKGNVTNANVEFSDFIKYFRDPSKQSHQKNTRKQYRATFYGRAKN